MKLALKIIFSFTQKPVYYIIFLGFLLIFLSFVIVLLSLFKVNFVMPNFGMMFLFSLMFFTGIQLICLGFIGLYAGFILDEVKRRPKYIIDKKINFG